MNIALLNIAVTTIFRCTVCRRLIGLWSLINIADELKKTTPSEATSDRSSSRKRTLSEANESTTEDDDNKRVTRQSPKKNKNHEHKDAPTPKRMKTRSQDNKTEESTDSNPEEEKMECLLITSPTTQVEKVKI